MELLIPVLALGGLYAVSKQKQSKSLENYQNSHQRIKNELLPNIDIPNRNFPDEYPINDPEADLTSKLSTTNLFNAPSVYTDKYFNPNMNEAMIVSAMDSPPAQVGSAYTSMTGQAVDMDYFRHNNMTPYFGSKVHTNNASNATESTLDSYTGSASQYISKTEQSPLFAPSENQQWAFGMPSTADFVQSRQNPSMRMANVKPFESIQVGPGLGLGFTSEGVGGFNSGLLAREEWRDRTVDELRVDNKQKASGLGMYGYEGPAYSHVPITPQVEHHGIVEKNRVERAFELGPERLMTTTGLEKGPTMRSINIERNVTRPDTTTDYTGVAGNGRTMQQVRGEYMPTHNQQLESFPLSAAYAANRGGAHEHDYGVKSQVAYPNNRSLPRNATQEDGYYGAVKNTLGAAVAPFMDMLRPSRKENTVGNMRPYQNAKAPVEAPYVYNPNDTAPVTHRQTMEESKYLAQVNANQRGGAYASTPHQAISNERDTTTDFYYAGNAVGAKEARAYDAEYRQRNNDIKSSTIDGRMVQGGMALLNSDVNMRSKPQEDMLKNNRAVQGSRFGAPPSIETMGILQGSPGMDVHAYSSGRPTEVKRSMQLYSGQQLDRNSGDIMSQLKGNPYTLSVVNGL